MESYIHPDNFIDYGRLPSLKFERPVPRQENQETTSPSLSISDLYIRLHCDTSHNVLNLVNRNTTVEITSYTETHVQSRVYLRNEALDRDLTTVLLNWNVPEIYHVYIITSILEQVWKVVPDCATALATLTPCLLRVDITCDKFYTPGSDGLEEEESYENHNDDGMVPASESAIDSMVVRERKRKREEFEEEEEGEESSSCPICLDEFIIGSETGSLPCSHTFHDDCITNWLRKSHYCPLCRFEMPTGYTTMQSNDLANELAPLHP